MRYDFLCIFKTLGRMQQKKHFFLLVVFLRNKKKTKRFKKNFPKKTS
jgi:hypothetical protein